MAKGKKEKPIPLTDDLYHSEFQDFYASLFEESDRGSVLIGTAYLDDALKLALTSFFVADEEAVGQLFDFGRNGPLCNFSAKIKTAFCLGVIGVDIRDDLEVIRGLRNDFAHFRTRFTFQQDSVRDRTANLKILAEAADHIAPDWNARDKFVFAVSSIAIYLVNFARNLQHRAPGPGYSYVENGQLPSSFRVDRSSPGSGPRPPAGPPPT